MDAAVLKGLSQRQPGGDDGRDVLTLITYQILAQKPPYCFELQKGYRWVIEMSERRVLGWIDRSS